MDGDEGFEGLDFIGEDGLDFQAGPERLRGLVIPSVDDTASNVLTLGCGLFNAGGFTDVDGQVGFGFGHVDITASAIVMISVGHVGMRMGMGSGVYFGSSKPVVDSICSCLPPTHWRLGTKVRQDDGCFGISGN